MENENIEAALPDTPVATVDTTGKYIVDEKVRTTDVEYTELKMVLRHGFVKPDDRELIQYYLNAPAVTAIMKGQRRPLGQPAAPAAVLHDQACSSLDRLDLNGNVLKTFDQAQIRELSTSLKADGTFGYIGGYYDVKISVDSGDLDDLIFGRATQFTATVKTRPGVNGKVDKTFKIFLTRPDDLTMERFTSQASSNSFVDKSDSLLSEFLGDEAIAEMTGGEDEGERVAFSKTITHVRHFFDIVNKNFDGAENVLFEGQDYTPASRNKFLQALDPALKIQIGQALRNFM